MRAQESDEVRLAKADGTSDGVECSKVLSEVEGR